MKLYTYVVTHDTGFAPNPFWGYCTLAACTPNHVGICPCTGDWFIGTEPIGRGNKLVYAMEVCEVLPFDEYFKDPRFQKKKPVINGTWRQRCGDNIYFRDKTGTWQQYPSLYHRARRKIEQDLKHPRVFIAKHFYYFGDNAKPIPSRYDSMIRKRQGVKGNHDPDLVNDFLRWLQTTLGPGVHGEPYESSNRTCCQ